MKNVASHHDDLKFVDIVLGCDPDLCLPLFLLCGEHDSLRIFVVLGGVAVLPEDCALPVGVLPLMRGRIFLGVEGGGERGSFQGEWEGCLKGGLAERMKTEVSISSSESESERAENLFLVLMIVFSGGEGNFFLPVRCWSAGRFTSAGALLLSA